MTETPILSTSQLTEFSPEGSLRRYVLAPLSYSEKQAFDAEMTRRTGIYPGQELMFGVLREVVREISPGNADELCAVVDAAEAGTLDAAGRTRLGLIEVQASRVQAYADLLAARNRRLGELPWVLLLFALRGWSGPGLPEFRRGGDGRVPEELLAQMPVEDVPKAGWRAYALLTPGPSAVGNSAPPSPSSTSPTRAGAARNRRKGGGGSSPARNGSATRA